MIKVKSIHTDRSDDDGFRALVEPVWPRKAHREKTFLNIWLRDLAPSPGLASLYSNNMLKWEEFVTRYHRELDNNRSFIKDLQDHNRNGGLTLVYGSGNENCNTAVALKLFLENDDPI
jgi:uncharacterized protein YeaO (DUF488 family)